MKYTFARASMAQTVLTYLIGTLTAAGRVFKKVDAVTITLQRTQNQDDFKTLKLSPEQKAEIRKALTSIQAVCRPDKLYQTKEMVAREACLYWPQLATRFWNERGEFRPASVPSTAFQDSTNFTWQRVFVNPSSTLF